MDCFLVIVGTVLAFFTKGIFLFILLFYYLYFNYKNKKTIRKK